MTLAFTKMHGLGNDFMVIDAINQSFHLNAQQLVALADRHTGVGFDQCLLVERSANPEIDFFYRIFNADGQEVGQCGNGARCLARFVVAKGLTDKKTLRVATKTTELTLSILADNRVQVNMGKPWLQPDKIPLIASAQQDCYAISLDGYPTQHLHALSIGNPHAVMVVDNLAHAPVQTLGKLLSEHPAFPEQANIGFMQIVSPSSIHLRVYERGCGETRACGSGAVAAVAAGRLFHGLAPQVEVSLPGGSLRVDWADPHSDLLLIGFANFVYEGTLAYDNKWSNG